MKCTECPKYSECVLSANLLLKRKNCELARKKKVITNFERIKAMSIEEMANFIADIYADNEHAEIRVNGEWLTAEDMEQWLESEVEE